MEGSNKKKSKKSRSPHPKTRSNLKDTKITKYFIGTRSSKKRSEPEHSNEKPLAHDSKKIKIQENPPNERPIKLGIYCLFKK